jgi:site-specific recombinase XerD
MTQRYGLGRVYQRGAAWWIQYSVRGKKQRESSGSTRRTVAVRLLRRRLEEVSSGRFVGLDAERVTFENLAELLMEDYRTNGRRSLDRARLSIAHLRDMFGMDRAVDISADRLHRYVNARLDDGAARATVQNELAALKRMFRLAVKRGKAHRVPAFPTLRISNAREEFIESDELAALMIELPDYLCGMIEFAYLTGWRMASEIRPLTWTQVDFDAGTVRLRMRTTKNDEGRVFPFDVLPQLRDVLDRQRLYTDTWEQRTGKLIPWVFHRQGNEIKDFRHAWRAACRRAGVFGADRRPKVPHDFRRTAVRNLERAAVPRSVAMQLVGHKTESVYRRYAITAERDLREGVEKLAALHQTGTKRAQSEPKTISGKETARA